MSQTGFNPRGVVKSVAKAKYMKEVQKLCGTFVQNEELEWFDSLADQLRREKAQRNRLPKIMITEPHRLVRYSDKPEECLPALAFRFYQPLDIPERSEVVRHLNGGILTLVLTTPERVTHTFTRNAKVWSVKSSTPTSSGRRASMRFGGRGPSAESE